MVLLLRFHQVSVDPAQIAHQFTGHVIGVAEMLRYAKDLKLKARAVTEAWTGLMRLPLPAIVQRADESFVIVGKVTEKDILIQDPAGRRPQAVGRAEFEANWNGCVVLRARRASLADLARLVN
jgi:ATP-binding cassette, subfamily B, bacterial HlyB/CyaB